VGAFRSTSQALPQTGARLWRLPVTLLGRLGLWGPFEGVGSSSLRGTQPPLGWILRALTGWKVIPELLPV